MQPFFLDTLEYIFLPGLSSCWRSCSNNGTSQEEEPTPLVVSSVPVGVLLPSARVSNETTNHEGIESDSTTVETQ